MNRIKQLRNEFNLSQTDLAKIIGVHYRTLQNWENNKSEIKNEKAEKLSEYFGVSTGYLLGFSDYKNVEEYWDEVEETNIIDIDILNSIESIGEKFLPYIRDYMEKEFYEEYSNVKDAPDDFSVDESVKIAMGNVNDSLWGLPDSIVQLIFYWTVLSDDNRKSIKKIIIDLAENNLKKINIDK